MADIDGDGDLDLHVVNYGAKSVKDGGKLDIVNVNGQLMRGPFAAGSVRRFEYGADEFFSTTAPDGLPDSIGAVVGSHARRQAAQRAVP